MFVQAINFASVLVWAGSLENHLPKGMKEFLRIAQVTIDFASILVWGQLLSSSLAQGRGEQLMF